MSKPRPRQMRDAGPNAMSVLRAVVPVVLVSLVFFTCACTGSSPFMDRAPTNVSPPADPPGVARVIFFRPSSYAFNENFRIIDHAGRFVGEAVADSYFIVKPPAGEYVFILGEDEIDVLYANLAPGLTYYVEVVPVIGSFAVRAQLRPVRPSDPEWRQLGRDLRTQLLPRFDKGQAVVDHDAGLRSRIERAKKMWAELSPQERPAHSIGPREGVAPAP